MAAAVPAEGKIKAFAVMEAGGKVVDWEYTPLPLAEDEVEIHIEACGVCHSDLNQATNFWGGAEYPIVVGHEIIGTVSQVGAGVQDLKLGQRVGVGPQSSHCTHCKWCAAGEENCCPGIGFNYNSPTRDPVAQPHTYGGFAHHTRVKAAWAFPIPEALCPVAAAPLLCAGLTTWSPLLNNVKPGDRVGVLGVGGLGHVGLQFANKLGAHVVAISRTAGKAAEAKKFGAHEVLITEDPDQVKAFNRSLDYILATVSANNADWDLYLELLAQRGKVLLVGLPTQLEFNPLRLVNRGLAIEGSLLSSIKDVRKMLEFCAEHKIVAQVEALPMTAEGANQALEKVDRNEPRYRMVLVNYEHPNCQGKKHAQCPAAARQEE